MTVRCTCPGSPGVLDCALSSLQSCMGGFMEGPRRIVSLDTAVPQALGALLGVTRPWTRASGAFLGPSLDWTRRGKGPGVSPPAAPPPGFQLHEDPSAVIRIQTPENTEQHRELNWGPRNVTCDSDLSAKLR